MSKNLHLKKEWYGHAQAVCYGLSAFLLMAAALAAVQLYLLMDAEPGSTFLFWDIPDDPAMRGIIGLGTGVLFLFAILFCVVAASFRAPIHEIGHDAMLKDISQATEGLLKQQLNGFYKDIATQIRVTRMVLEIQKDMPRISHEAAEIAAVVSNLLAKELKPLQVEVERAANSVAVAKQQSDELLRELSEMLETVQELDERSQRVEHADGDISTQVSQLQRILAAIQARVEVQQETTSPTVTPPCRNGDHPAERSPRSAVSFIYSNKRHQQTPSTKPLTLDIQHKT